MLLPQSIQPFVSFDAWFKNFDSDLLNDFTLEPMTLRFLKHENGVISTESLVGKTAGKKTSNFYKGKDMWGYISEIYPHLQSITHHTGDILHLACIVDSSKKSVERLPLFLVETTRFDSAAKAAGFSKGNLRNSSIEVSPRVWQANHLKYLEFIKTRNAAWIARHQIEFQDEPNMTDTSDEDLLKPINDLILSIEKTIRAQAETLIAQEQALNSLKKLIQA